MPIGNGDIGLNVWVESSGAVDFYIGKTDAWSDPVTSDTNGNSLNLYKLAGARVTLNPNPLSSGTGTPFAQLLMLHSGEMLTSPRNIITSLPLPATKRVS